LVAGSAGAFCKNLVFPLSVATSALILQRSSSIKAKVKVFFNDVASEDFCAAYTQ
jgi:hypothetical protein